MPARARVRARSHTHRFASLLLPPSPSLPQRSTSLPLSPHRYISFYPPPSRAPLGYTPEDPCANSLMIAENDGRSRPREPSVYGKAHIHDLLVPLGGRGKPLKFFFGDKPPASQTQTGMMILLCTGRQRPTLQVFSL